MERPVGRKSLIQSVERALNILETVRDSKTPVRAVDIARAVGLSPAAANNIVRTLFIRGYLDQNEGGRYTLGGQSYLLGTAADAWGELRSAAREIMAELCRETNSLCFLGVESNGQVIAVNIAESAGPVIIPRNQDWLDQPHCTAAGKVLLAWMPPEKYAEFKASHELRKLTEKTILDWDTLERDLKKARANGFSVCQDESVFGLSSIAVPILSGSRAAALAVCFSSYYLNPEFRAKIVGRLKTAAAGISGKLQSK
jgi:IclR family acetate operon transcriptional repressor